MPGCLTVRISGKVENNGTYRTGGQQLMAFQYSCFISYRHVQYDLGSRFLEKFLEALKSHIELEIELDGVPSDEQIYIDRERLKGGYLFNNALADALCRSVCMIVIFTPTYFSKQKTYCAREFLAMKKLEEERLKQMGDRKMGLIIPIVLKGFDALPPEIRQERQCYDFSDYSLATPDILTHPVYNRQVAEIASYIREVHERLTALGVDWCGECPNYALPTDEEVLPFLEQIIARPHRQLFPFRTETHAA